MAAQDLQFLPLAASHNRAVLSQLAVTTVLPSGENCALSDPPSWPRKTCSSFPLAHPTGARSRPACGHHRLAIGRKLRVNDRALMAAQDLQFFSARRIPQPRCLVPACRHHRLAIGEKIVRCVTPPSWPRKTCSCMPLAHIPQPPRSCPCLRSPPSCHQEKIAR